MSTEIPKDEHITTEETASEQDEVSLDAIAKAAESQTDYRVRGAPLMPEDWYVNERVDLQRWPYSAKRNYKNKSPEPIYHAPHSFNLIADRISILDFVVKGAPNNTWDGAVRESLKVGLNNDSFIDAIKRPDARWVQAPEYEGRKVYARQEYYDNAPNAKLTGAQARAKHRNATKSGGLFRIPLWHSGFFVTFRTPSENDLLNLDRQIGMDKTRLGWKTQGAVFSAVDIFINDALFKFALDHVVDANIENFEPDMLRLLLRSFDYYTFIWGFASTIYLDGYNLSQPCLVDPTKCKHVIETLLNMSRLSFTDVNLLTPAQLRHMSNGDKIFTRDEILKYQSEGVLADGKTYELPTTDEYDDAPVIKVVLKSGNMQEYLDTGKEWVSNLIFMVNSTVGKTFNSDNEREVYLSRRGLTTALRIYSHFIKRVVYDDGSFIEDREDIEGFLDDISVDDFMREKLFKHVQDYINSTVISVIALPAFKCPACGGFNHNDHPRHPNLIPIEVNQLFFTLLDRKARRAIDKEPLV